MPVGLSTASPGVADALVRHRPALLRYARSVLHGTGIDPDDAVQDVQERALARGHPGAAQLPYLLRAVRNRCIDLRHERGRARAEPGALEVLAGGVDPADHVIAREAIEEILADVAALPAAQRDVFLAHVVGVLGQAEERRTPSAVKGLVFRARRSLVLLRAARDTPCHEIQAAFEVSRRRGVRRSELVRRHLALCPACQAATLRRGAAAVLGPVVTWLGSLGTGGAKSAMVAGTIAAGGLAAEAPVQHLLAPEPSRAAPAPRRAPVARAPARSDPRPIVRLAPAPPARVAARPAKRHRPAASRPVRRSATAVDDDAPRWRYLARPEVAAALRRATTAEERRHMTPRAQQVAAYRELRGRRPRRRATARARPAPASTPAPARTPTPAPTTAPPPVQPAPGEPAPTPSPAPVAPEPTSSPEPTPIEPAPTPVPTPSETVPPPAEPG